VSPRSSAEDAAATRAAIVARAMDRASVEGLEGLTIGRLAADLGMSKAGVVGPFGSKQALQLAVFGQAIDGFAEQVWAPVAALPAGRERLLAVCERWIDYLAGPPFPGGCLMTTTATEWDARQGPVRDAVVDAQGRWLALLEADAEVAVRAGELPADTDPAQVAFELNGVAMSLNQAVQLFHDPGAAAAARRAVSRILVSPRA
jgi:AcrR family transcriptional regulator